MLDPKHVQNFTHSARCCIARTKSQEEAEEEVLLQSDAEGVVVGITGQELQKESKHITNENQIKEMKLDIKIVVLGWIMMIMTIVMIDDGG